MNPAMIDEAQGTRILLSIQRIFEQEVQDVRIWPLLARRLRLVVVQTLC